MPKEKFQRGESKMSFDEILSKVTQPLTPAREKMREATFQKMKISKKNSKKGEEITSAE